MSNINATTRSVVVRVIETCSILNRWQYNNVSSNHGYYTRPDIDVAVALGSHGNVSTKKTYCKAFLSCCKLQLISVSLFFHQFLSNAGITHKWSLVTSSSWIACEQTNCINTAMTITTKAHLTECFQSLLLIKPCKYDPVVLVLYYVYITCISDATDNILYTGKRLREKTFCSFYLTTNLFLWIMALSI